MVPSRFARELYEFFEVLFGFLQGLFLLLCYGSFMQSFIAFLKTTRNKSHDTRDTKQIYFKKASDLTFIYYNKLVDLSI
jgi:hypothetical protein